MRVVVALGGNALSPNGGNGSVAEMRAALVNASEVLANVVAAGVSLVITHGNGPQIGRILLQQESAAEQVPPMPMDVCDAESQGQIGYLLAQSLDNALRAKGVPQQVSVLVTQVIVDRADPAFSQPTKPIGPCYSAAEAEEIRQRTGFTFANVENGQWRRVVASPLPIGFVEENAITTLAESQNVLVAAGGGGVPVVKEGALYQGIEAVVDKDRTAALLAQILQADQLVILTAVNRVQVGFGTAEAKSLGQLTVAEARQLLTAAEFAPGSMGPKVEACCDFVAGGGKRAVIAALGDAEGAIFGDEGTVITQ